MVVLAGCAGGAGTLTESPQSNGASETTSSGSADAGETGTVNFYVSDEENAIGDFEHLNVTIEQVTFVRAEGGENAEAESEDDDASKDESTEDESVEANASVNVSNNTTAINATATVDAAAENETESEGDADAEVESEDEAESSGKVTYEVDNVTVDLTELKGENATLVDSYDLPKGDYNAVYVEVSEVNGTLETGEQVNIKLPSNKLHITSEFTVASDEDVDFVFDITAFKAGKSGKYILKPVISESGTNVPIENVDEPDEKPDDEAEDENAEEEEEEEAEEAEQETEAEAEAEAETELSVSVDGNVTPGENATLVVTQNGSAVENATVTVNDEVVGTTDADGTLDVAVPLTTDLSVKVTHDDAEAELEFEFEGEVSKTVEDDSETPEGAGKSDNSTA
ncbi:hypothetical protein AUR66_02805 [Haloferax profundi]|uniref:DUF4382 domain-containing protein n=1 Tax=Haloferax profundi TaxID=1544718 RepID=A0A0W1RU29_9EURY|nr:hypothetical protein AUR66_02805 [Haloferax profundi]